MTDNADYTLFGTLIRTTLTWSIPSYGLSLFGLAVTQFVAKCSIEYDLELQLELYNSTSSQPIWEHTIRVTETKKMRLWQAPYHFDTMLKPTLSEAIASMRKAITEQEQATRP